MKLLKKIQETVTGFLFDWGEEVFTVIAAASVIVLVYFGFFRVYESRWYYRIFETSERCSFEYVKEITEKDKPVMHEIRVESVGSIQVTDDIYNEWYKDYNTVTVTTYHLNAKEMVSMGFGDGVNSWDVVRKKKYVFPYTVDVVQFTEEDLRTALDKEESYHSASDDTEAKNYDAFEKESPEYKLLE